MAPRQPFQRAKGRRVNVPDMNRTQTSITLAQFLPIRNCRRCWPSQRMTSSTLCSRRCASIGQTSRLRSLPEGRKPTPVSGLSGNPQEVLFAVDPWSKLPHRYHAPTGRNSGSTRTTIWVPAWCQPARCGTGRKLIECHEGSIAATGRGFELFELESVISERRNIIDSKPENRQTPEGCARFMERGGQCAETDSEH